MIKKIVIMLLMSMFLFACDEASNCDQNNKPSLFTNTAIASPKIVEIDNCEYIQYYLSYGYSTITHKGNCKYCMQRIKNRGK